MASLSWLEQQEIGRTSAEVSPGPLNVEELQPLIEHLADLLRDMDPEAEVAALALRRRLGGGAAQAAGQELVVQLAKFDFESAGHTLARLRAELEAV